MLRLAVLALAATSAAAASPSALTPSAPWWEKVTVTISGDGGRQSCRYETSTPPAEAEPCSADLGPLKFAAELGSATYTSITFERRFSPGELPEPGSLKPGDQLLGGQIMAISIDRKGMVRACQIIAMSGDLLPDYDCDKARAERFQASTGRQPDEGRLGYFTILVYGHSAQVV